jgi:enamine deaminase RidA (YjgF/YER057c/UK114 family)
MLKQLNPETAPKPVSPTYSQAVEGGPNLRWLHISGQVGVDRSGKVQQGAEAQLDQIWRNILAILDAAGMGPQDLVKVTTFLTRKEDIPLSRQVRQRHLGEVQPASTLLVVAGLASPDYLAEIEAVAAKPQ